MNKEIKIFGAALAFMFCGTTLMAQQTQMTTQDMAQTDVEVDYESIFEDVDNTEDHDILTLLKQDDNFSIFVEMLEKSQIDLDAAAEAAGEITVFAPTNDAFKQLTKEQYKQITEPEDLALLQSIVKSHVMTKKVNLADFQTNQVIENADGQEIAVETAGGQGVATPADDVMIGGARIGKPDIQASNGVIHVMEGVVIPDQQGSTTGFGAQ
ncbi:fasciclin domain-containing protein [Litoribacter populi]|uniref:fasciclin domain-containing protein n=1 Tax=Litoribacter populi TaxID=2598460 RepID=UPI00117E0A45|nr:fasciclin domain-containing protein [Litoribacter populi]